MNKRLRQKRCSFTGEMHTHRLETVFAQEFQQRVHVRSVSPQQRQQVVSQLAALHQGVALLKRPVRVAPRA